jgi:hypothetical protein
MEGQQHEAHLAKLQQRQENQRQLEQQAHLAGLQQRQEQRQLEGQQHEAYLAELQQSQENQRQLEEGVPATNGDVTAGSCGYIATEAGAKAVGRTTA